LILSESPSLTIRATNQPIQSHVELWDMEGRTWSWSVLLFRK